MWTFDKQWVFKNIFQTLCLGYLSSFQKSTPIAVWFWSMFPRKDILNWSTAGSLLCLLFVFNIVILTLVTFCHKPSLGREWLMAFKIIFWSLQDIIFDCIMMTIISQLLQTGKDHSGNHILFLWVFYSACSLSNVVIQATLLAWPLKLDQITSYLQEVFRLCNLWI